MYQLCSICVPRVFHLCSTCTSAASVPAVFQLCSLLRWVFHLCSSCVLVLLHLCSSWRLLENSGEFPAIHSVDWGLRVPFCKTLFSNGVVRRDACTSCVPFVSHLYSTCVPLARLRQVFQLCSSCVHFCGGCSTCVPVVF